MNREIKFKDLKVLTLSVMSPAGCGDRS